MCHVVNSQMEVSMQILLFLLLMCAALTLGAAQIYHAKGKVEQAENAGIAFAVIIMGIWLILVYQ